MVDLIREPNSELEDPNYTVELLEKLKKILAENLGEERAQDFNIEELQESIIDTYNEREAERPGCLYDINRTLETFCDDCDKNGGRIPGPFALMGTMKGVDKVLAKLNNNLPDYKHVPPKYSDEPPGYNDDEPLPPYPPKYKP